MFWFIVEDRWDLIGLTSGGIINEDLGQIFIVDSKIVEITFISTEDHLR